MYTSVCNNIYLKISAMFYNDASFDNTTAHIRVNCFVGIKHSLTHMYVNALVYTTDDDGLQITRACSVSRRDACDIGTVARRVGFDTQLVKPHILGLSKWFCPNFLLHLMA